RPVAGDGRQPQSGGDHDPGGGRHYHRTGWARRPRLRHGGVADVRPLARLLLRPARRSLRVAAGHGAAGGRSRGARVLRDPWRRRRASAGVARATHGAVCAHSNRGTPDVTLSAQSLTKRYGAAPGYEAVRDASLELRPGEFVSIVGRSG